MGCSLPPAPSSVLKEEIRNFKKINQQAKPPARPAFTSSQNGRAMAQLDSAVFPHALTTSHRQARQRPPGTRSSSHSLPQCWRGHCQCPAWSPSPPLDGVLAFSPPLSPLPSTAVRGTPQHRTWAGQPQTLQRPPCGLHGLTVATRLVTRYLCGHLRGRPAAPQTPSACSA